MLRTSEGRARRVGTVPLFGLLLGLLLLLLWPGVANAGNPDLRWRTIETEHFYVHYYVGEEEAAERTAEIAEKAYEELSVAWGHDVFLKTHIQMTDNQDTANGRATAVPYPQIMAYATAPEALSVLEAYDDWLDILITHELVHVVHLDTVHGLARAINAIFGLGVLGKITSPNILQPRWIVEGVATVHESKYSSQGRRRSAQFNAFIRMAVLEGRFQTLDQVSSSARIYPHGTSVYLYGVEFMYYIAARYGNDKLRELSHIYAVQPVPFGINKAIKRVTGASFYELWRDFKDHTTKRFQAQARRLRSRGLRQGRRLTYAGENTRYPMWAADDSYVYFYKSDGHREEGLKRIRPQGGRTREGVGIGRQGADVDVEHMIDIESAGEASFIGATGDVVFDMNGTYDFRFRWSDLYRWNGGDSFRFEQLTFGMRASEPHVSPDGRTIVFRRNDIAQSRLAFLELDTLDVTEVPPAERIAQVYTPRWHPDGKRVAFSGFRRGGYRDIYIYDVESGETQRVTADRHMDLSPTWSPDGRYLVFGSDRDEVYNIYAYDLETHRLHQVSNVLGGAFEPSVSQDGTRVAYVGYTAVGYDLWVMDFDPKRWLEVMPSVAELPIAEDSRPPIAANRGRPASLRSTRYQPIKTFFPRTFFPTALDFQSSDFGTGLGFETEAADALGFHTLVVGFNYNLDRRIATGGVSYAFRRLWPNFSIAANRGFSERGGFTRFLYDREDGQESYEVRRYRERSTRVSASMSLPVIRSARHSADADIGYRWTRWRNLDEDDVVIDPNAPATDLPEVGDAAQVDFGVSYSNDSDGSGRFTYGSEIGRRLSVRLGVLDERLGGDFGDLQVSGSWREAFPMPWRGHQSLRLRIRGNASAGGLDRRGAFCVGDVISGQEAVRAILARQGFSNGGCTLLRGYEPASRTGRYVALATAEYRIPLLDVDRGIGTVPLFFTRVGLVPFADWGSAFTNPVEARDLLVGAGGALVMSFRVGYLDTLHLFLQYAHGFMNDEGGTNTFRAVISTSL